MSGVVVNPVAFISAVHGRHYPDLATKKYPGLHERTWLAIPKRRRALYIEFLYFEIIWFDLYSDGRILNKIIGVRSSFFWFLISNKKRTKPTTKIGSSVSGFLLKIVSCLFILIFNKPP